MRISMMVAMCPLGSIGFDGDLPWGRSMKADLARFVKETTGKPVIMGRKTYESIIESLGRPLPNRTSIVLTRNEQFVAVLPGVLVVYT